MWRVVQISQWSASMNMALDEAVCNAIAEGTSNPTIRFYTWYPSAVSIGYFQELLREVDVDFCAKNGVDIVRRRTGGGAVYHDSKGEITYSVLAPEDYFPRGIIDSYKVICGWIIDGFKGIGINAEFKPINDIVTNGKKISGNAQTRRNGILQQHGTILYSLDVDMMFRCLKVSDEKIRDKMISTVKERVTSIRDIDSSIDFDRAYLSILHAFCKNKEFYFGDFSDSELEEAKHLAKTKYSSREWNYWR